jgi:hypothetical protein
VEPDMMFVIGLCVASAGAVVWAAIHSRRHPTRPAPSPQIDHPNDRAVEDADAAASRSRRRRGPS